MAVMGVMYMIGYIEMLGHNKWLKLPEILIVTLTTKMAVLHALITQIATMAATRVEKNISLRWNLDSLTNI